MSINHVLLVLYSGMHMRLFPVSSTLQRLENTYYTHIPAMGQSTTDGVYSHLHRGDTSKTSHRNTSLPPPTYSSLATTQPQVANEQELPPDYSMITQENISSGTREAQNPSASAGAGAGAVYSTVVRQGGEKITVKLETPASTDEDPELNHGHTPSMGFPSTRDNTCLGEPNTEDDGGAHDMDYFDDPRILQQIRAHKQ